MTQNKNLLKYCCFFIFFCLALFSAGCSQRRESVDSDNTESKKIEWSKADSVLYISGKGRMEDYFDNAAPWGNDINSVVIEEGITHVGAYAFSACSNLVAVSLPEGLESIGEGAFEKCVSLKKIAIPDTCRVIGKRAFFISDDVSSPLQVKLPDNWVSVGDMAFSAVRITNSKISISQVGLAAFCMADISKTETIVFQEGCKIIPDDAFGGSIYTRPTPENGLYSWILVEIPSSVETIGERAFHSRPVRTCSFAENAALQSIGASAFEDCDIMGEIHLPRSLVEIGDRAFSGNSFSEITLPSELKHIGSGAFAGCYAMQSCYILGCPLLAIENNTFADCNSLSQINLPKTIEYIGSRAFYGTALGSIHIPESVQWIGSEAFSYSYLWKVTFEKGIQNIGERAFYGCGELLELDLPDGMQSIGLEAFGECTSLRYVRLPEGLLTIEDRAFTGCKSITTLSFPEGVSIGKNITEGCSNFHIVVFPTNISCDLGQFPFYPSGEDGRGYIFYRGTKGQWEQTSGVKNWNLAKDAADTGDLVIEFEYPSRYMLELDRVVCWESDSSSIYHTLVQFVGYGQNNIRQYLTGCKNEGYADINHGTVAEAIQAGKQELCAYCAAHDDTTHEFKPKNNTLNLIVPGEAGSAKDIICRLIAQYTARYTDISIVISNIPGDSGVMATNKLLNSYSDGTYMLAYSPSIAAGSDDITMVSMITQNPCLIAIGGYDDRFSTLSQAVKYASKNKVTIGAVNGSIPYYFAILFAKAAGVEDNMTIVPFDGVDEVVNCLLSGDVDMVALLDSDFSTNVSYYINLLEYYYGDTWYKVLCLSGDSSIGKFHDLPTFKELGSNLEMYYSFGFAMKSGTDERIVKYWSDIFSKITSDVDFLREAEEEHIFIHYMDYVDYSTENQEEMAILYHTQRGDDFIDPIRINDEGDPGSEPETETAPISSAMSYEEYIEAELDTEVTVLATIQWAAYDTENQTADLFLANEDGGYYIFHMSVKKKDADLMERGRVLLVKGTKNEWYGEIEIGDASYWIVKEQEAYFPQPKNMLVMTDENMKECMNQYVFAQGGNVVARVNKEGESMPFTYRWNGSGQEGDDIYIDIQFGEDIYTFVLDSCYCGPETDLYKRIQDLEIGDYISHISAFLYWHEEPQPYIATFE